MPNSLTDTCLAIEKQLHVVGEGACAQRLGGLRQAFRQTELRVVVFGEFNRGKSTLINALLGRCVLPAKLVPTTGHVTRIVYGVSDEVRVRFVGGCLETFSLEQLSSFSTLDRNGVAREDVEGIEVAVDHPLLKDGIVLLDTPGVNEREEQTRRASEAIAVADLVLLILDARQLLNSTERELAFDWIGGTLGKPLGLIVNFMNFVDEAERDNVRRRLKRWRKSNASVTLGRPWFEVNALHALAHAVGRGGPPEDDFWHLRSALTACGSTLRIALQQRSRRRQLLVMLSELQERNRQVVRELHNDAKRVARKRETRRQDLVNLRRRLAVEAATAYEGVCGGAMLLLERKLKEMIETRFRQSSKKMLDAKALEWCVICLSSTVRKIEKLADDALLEMTTGLLQRPAPLTIVERMVWNTRLTTSAAPFQSGIAAVDAGVAIGRFIGGVLGSWFKGRRVDYASAYVVKANEFWGEATLQVQQILRMQFDARVAEMRAQLSGMIEQIAAPLPATAELQQRKLLETVLEQGRQMVGAT